MSGPSHPTLQRLLELWQIDCAEGSLGQLSARDLRYFSAVFKDSFIARGAPTGPFRLSFVGTNLEAHIGRKLINLSVKDCFGAAAAGLMQAGLDQALARRRPLYGELLLSSPSRPETASGELLCLPFVRDEGRGLDDTITLFGTVALMGLSQLPAEPACRTVVLLHVDVI